MAAIEQLHTFQYLEVREQGEARVVTVECPAEFGAPPESLSLVETATGRLTTFVLVV